MNNSKFSFINVTLPVGSVITFVGNVESYKPQNNPPFTLQPESQGWMLCDGSTLSASQYPELYAALGGLYGSYGSGDDTKFNLPDLRGQFLRGIGTDEASAEGRTSAPGGTTNGVGSTQKDALQIHEHKYSQPTGVLFQGNEGIGNATVNDNAFTGEPTSRSNPSSVHVSQYETRPTNVFVNYLIKFTSQLPSNNPMADL
ncbi:MAG: phage tail protein [Bacteroidota bacterium]